MTTELQPHQARIQRIGNLLWGFSWFWLIFNGAALLIAMTVVLLLGWAGQAGMREEVLDLFARGDLVPGLEVDTMHKILEWDYAAYVEHRWLSIGYISTAGVMFVTTMVLILRIAAAWKRGEVFGESPIRSFRTLGWIYLVHGIIGQAWGVAGQFVGASNTCDLIYFSFVRDVCLMSFSMSGTGIEWGFLCLALSWILEHAKLLRDEQSLVV